MEDFPWETGMKIFCHCLNKRNILQNVLCTNKQTVRTIFSTQLWNIPDQDSQILQQPKTPEVLKIILFFVYLNFFPPVQALLVFLHYTSLRPLLFFLFTSRVMRKQIDKCLNNVMWTKTPTPLMADMDCSPITPSFPDIVLVCVCVWCLHNPAPAFILLVFRFEIYI